jgi:hypothetical protein
MSTADQLIFARAMWAFLLTLPKDEARAVVETLPLDLCRAIRAARD